MCPLLPPLLGPGRIPGGVFLGLALALWGCQWQPSNQVVVYTTMEKKLVEPIFQKFTEKTGIQLVCQWPDSLGGTQDLLAAVLDQQGRPRCDLVWHLEPVQTVRLRQQNLLAAYEWAEGQRFSQWAKSPDGRWHGLAARARLLLLYSPAFKDKPSDQIPSSILDLANSKYRSKVAMAGPTSPTAVAHLACLCAFWGPERTKQFLGQLRENQVQFFPTEEETARKVAEGRCLLALTDSDQAIRLVDKGSPVFLVYPDQRENQPGCLFLPSTIGIFRKAVHPWAARQLADYLLDPQVETQLTNGPAALVPLNYEVTAFSRIPSPDNIKALKVDYRTAAGYWEEILKFFQQQLATTQK